MDTGNNYRIHVRGAYDDIIEKQCTEEWNVGSLEFGGDELSALQAADVIAWSARRELTNEFNKGLEPLQELIESSHHYGEEVSELSMQQIAAGLRAKATPHKASQLAPS